MENGKYSWASSRNTNNVTEYYYKTYIYHNVYDDSAFKDVYLLNDIVVNAQNSQNIVNINFPCNMHLLYSDIILNTNFKVEHYYQGYYTFDSISGIIDNSNYQFSLVTPKGYYRIVNDLGLTTANFTNVFDLDFSAATNRDILLQDAEDLINGILDVDYYIGSNGVHAMVDNQIFPSQFNNMPLEINYNVYDATFENGEYAMGPLLTTGELSPSGNLNRALDNKYVFITYSFTFMGTEYTDPTYNRLINVVGTSDASMLTSYNLELEGYIYSSCEGNKLNKPIYIGLYNDQMGIAKKYNKNFILSIPASSANFLVLDPILTNQSVTGYILHESDIISADTTATLQVSLNSEVVNIDFTVQATRTFEKTAFLGRYINSFYLANVNARETLIGKNDPLIAGLGIADISYSMDIVTVENGTSTSEPFLNYVALSNETGTEINFGFSSTFAPSANQTIYLKTVVTYNNYESGFAELTAEEQALATTIYREIIIPGTGVGGDMTPQYVGNLFENIFSQHKETIYANPAQNDFSFSNASTYFTLEVDYEAIYQNMGITDETEKQAFRAQLDTYFELNEIGNVANPSNHIYQLGITTANIPMCDTTIYINAKISDRYTSAQEFASNAYHQTYSFVIAGIYFCNESDSFVDRILYKWLLNNYNDVYEAGDLRSEYLLVREARKEKASIDLSYDTMYNYFLTNSFFNSESLYSDLNSTNFAEHQLAINGLQFLINTKGFKFDGWNLLHESVKYLVGDSNQKVFAKSQNDTIKELSFVNCNLVNADVSYFSDLIRLETIDFTGNRMTAMPPLYRTVKTINLNNQFDGTNKTLNNIDGISSYVGAETIYLENNKIASFNPLIDLTEHVIKNVFISGNNVNNSDLNINHQSLIYGTDGVVNQTVYKWLRDEGVNVFNILPASTNNGYNLNYYYDARGNIINEVYVYKANYQNITGQKTDLVTNGSYYGAARDARDILGNSLTIYTKQNNVLTQVSSDETIYMRLPFNIDGASAYGSVIINSIMYEGIISIDRTNIITIPNTIGIYNVNVHLINNVVNNTHTISNITNGSKYVIIISIDYSGITVFREMVIQGRAIGG